MNYYNEFDPGAAQWLRNLIDAKLLPAGTVDERDIRLVQPADLRGFAQCHFFAGIAGWPLALRLAGWDDSRPVWTGSCPCQPFSVCGNRKGEADERHLWPEFLRLIAGGKPPVVFGEQVDSPDGVEWLSGVRTDLEACGYEVGAAGLPAAGNAAPHIRQRLWWVADTPESFLRQVAPAGYECRHGSDHRPPGDMAHAADPNGRRGERGTKKGAGPAEQRGRGSCQCGGDGDLEHAAGQQMGVPGLSRKPRSPGYWDAFDVVQCTDGKARRIEPGTFPMAHGVPARVVKLRAYGNAIVPEVAAEFVRAYMEVRGIV